METIKKILSDLEFIPEENKNEYVSQSEIYLFILEKIGSNNRLLSNYEFYNRLAAAAISSQLARQENYGCPSFEEDTIYDLLVDRDDDQYKAIFDYIFGKIAYLEHQNINKIDMFFGENLKIEYDLLLNIFAKIITADLNVALEKVKNKLLSNLKKQFK